MITEAIARSIDESVLCWLATISEDGFPNVSPKEAFLHDGEGKILIANIASPGSVRNIEREERVCLSFVSSFIQKGHKIVGTATIVRKGDPGYEEKEGKLVAMIGSDFPFLSLIEVDPISVQDIIAPSYHLFPGSGPMDRIRESLLSYRVDHYREMAKQPDETTQRSDAHE